MPEPQSSASAIAISISKKRSRLLRWLGLVSVLALLAAVVLYRSSPALLTVDSGPCKAGAIVVLGGDLYGRPLRAAELFREQAAPLIIVTGNGDFEEMFAALNQNGVPQEAVRREDKSRNTWENAACTIAMLRQAQITNVIVVTSWYHSRRALNTFRKTAPDIAFYSRPSLWGQDRALWSQHRLGKHIRLEYVKLLGYWVRYGVSPF